MEKLKMLIEAMKMSRNKYLKKIGYFADFNIASYFLKVLFYSAKAASYYNRGFANTFKQCYRLSHKEGFGPGDQYLLGLLNPELKPDDFKKYCSQRKMRSIQDSVNPVSWMPVTEDKSVFYRYCAANDISIPKLHAIFFNNTSGWTSGGGAPKTGEDWIKYFENNAPSEFVVKPARGFYGHEIGIFKKSGKEFSNVSGGTHGADRIVDFMSSSSRFDSFVVQERLKSHPELVRLSDSEVLQCVRFTTFVDADNNPHILHRQLKIVVGSSAIDNFEYGKTGNVIAQISPTGFLDLVVTMKQGIPGVVNVETHPKTGLNFKEYKVPMWEEACEFAKDAAVKFSPIRAVGWDVAITPDGPSLIEGNFYFDAPNWHGALEDILGVILPACKNS